MIPVLCLLFVLSGAAGLIYESIWTRYLGLFVGHDAYAQIVVLVIFLGGMSAGAMAVSRWGHRARNPLLAYALVEFAVGGASGSCSTTSSRGRPTWPTTPCFRRWRARPRFRRQMGAGERHDPAPVHPARRHLPTDERGVLRLEPSRPGRTLALLYFCQQPRRGGRRPAGRLLPGCPGGTAGHARDRRDAQHGGRRADDRVHRGPPPVGGSSAFSRRPRTRASRLGRTPRTASSG